MRPVPTTKTLRIRSGCECTAPVLHRRYVFALAVNASCCHDTFATYSRRGQAMSRVGFGGDSTVNNEHPSKGAVDA